MNHLYAITTNKDVQCLITFENSRIDFSQHSDCVKDTILGVEVNVKREFFKNVVFYESQEEHLENTFGLVDLIDYIDVSENLKQELKMKIDEFDGLSVVNCQVVINEPCKIEAAYIVKFKNEKVVLRSTELADFNKSDGEIIALYQVPSNTGEMKIFANLFVKGRIVSVPITEVFISRNTNVYSGYLFITLDLYRALMRTIDALIR